MQEVVAYNKYIYIYIGGSMRDTPVNNWLLNWEYGEFVFQK